VFVIELATRRVQIVGSTPHPNDAFMIQAARTMTAFDDGALAHCRVLICDRESEVERPCTPPAGGIRRTRGTDAVPSAELQRTRGAVRTIY
jgi:hypothetical protein